MPSFGGFYDVAAGVDTKIEVGQGGLAGVLLGNESGLSCVVKMGSNYTRSLYPGWVDYFPVPAGFNGNIVVTPTAKLNNVSTWPGSFIQVDSIGLNEQVRGTYPAPLVRNSNIGNTINTVGGTSSSVQNDANAAGTSVVEATVTGDGVSAVKITNDAQVAFGSPTHPGTFSVDAGKITTDGAGHLVMTNGISIRWKDAGGNPQPAIIGVAGNHLLLTNLATGKAIQFFDVNTTEIAEFTLGTGLQLFSGGLKIPGASSLDGTLITTDGAGNATFANTKAIFFKDHLGAAQNVINVDVSDDLNLSAANAGAAVQLIVNSIVQAWARTDGFHANTVNFGLGSISKVSKFTANVTTTPTLFNHLLGAIPDIIILTPQGTTSTAFTAQYDTATLSSTQVKLTGNTAFTLTGLAIKF